MSGVTTNPFNDSTTSVQTTGTTNDGTNIVNNSTDTLGQDAFVKILTAELANQSPDNTQDSTQFIAQMAQFSGVEQMLNLNRTMTYNSATSLIGKSVVLNDTDIQGNQYRGTVGKVTKNGDSIKVYVNLVDSSGNPIYQEKLDPNGVPEMQNGKPVYETTQQVVLDSNNKPVIDPATGKVEYKDVPVNKVMAFDYSDVGSISNNISDTNMVDTEQQEQDLVNQEQNSTSS